MSITDNEYSGAFDDKSFWTKLRDFAKTAGSEVVEKALWLYYAFQNEATPAWAKSTIVGALGYFIVPLDAITDVVPVAGYTDDLGVLALAVASVATYINDDVRAQAAAKMRDWFGASE